MQVAPLGGQPNHHRVFVRFGKTKGEIWVEKGDFRGDLRGFWRVWTLFGNQPPHPPTFEKDLPKKTEFIFGSFPYLPSLFYTFISTYTAAWPSIKPRIKCQMNTQENRCPFNQWGFPLFLMSLKCGITLQIQNIWNLTLADKCVSLF